MSIVGMGTAPDLITIRGSDVIKNADVILVGDEQEREQWKDFIRQKEVWYCPNSLRSMYGIDPTTLDDQQQRVRAVGAAKARQDLVDKIAAAVRGGRRVASLQGGEAAPWFAGCGRSSVSSPRAQRSTRSRY